MVRLRTAESKRTAALLLGMPIASLALASMMQETAKADTTPSPSTSSTSTSSETASPSPIESPSAEPTPTLVHIDDSGMLPDNSPSPHPPKLVHIDDSGLLRHNHPELPFTGDYTPQLAALGATALLAGVAMTAAARRRD